MSYSTYSSFKTDEFCRDVDFISWVVSPTEESNEFWNSFLEVNLNKLNDVQIASEYIKSFHFQEYSPSLNELTALKVRIWDDIDNPPIVKVWWKRSTYWAVVAVVLLVVSFCIILLNPSSDLYKTTYGEIKKINLSDGSVVTLNTNSSLKVSEKINSAAIREVWLEGEAYFDIASNKGTKFIVHTPETQVEVIGTKFNVNSRRQQTDVILHKGKVVLHAKNLRDVIMKPGNITTVSNKSKSIKLRFVKPEQYDVWRESLVVLDNKSVSELIVLLQDTHGISIQFKNRSLLSKELTGKLSIKSIDDFVENLATILDVQAEKTENGYIFT
jgi:transmembrane sensor